MKLIGVKAETSPSFSARVHSMCPPVPNTPAATTHSQVMPCGHSQTPSAGTSDIGTHSRVVQITMRSAGSVADSCLIWMATMLDSSAAINATRVPALNCAEPGRTISSTPQKPSATATQRRARTCSPSRAAAAMVTNSGVE